MAVPAPALRMRPLTVMDMLDESFRLYRAQFPLFAAIAVGLAIPAVALNLLSGGAASIGTAYTAIFTSNLQPQPPPGPAQLVFALLLYPVQLALVPFQTGGLLAAAVAVVLGRPVGLMPVFRTVLKRYWALWALSLLYGVTSITLLCLPLGVWLLIRQSVMIPAMLTEESSLGAAVSRSWQLTDHAFWRTLGAVVSALLLGYALQSSLAGLFIVIAGLFPGLPLELRAVVIYSVASLMTQLVEPLIALTITLVYFDRRVRLEGLDLEMQAYQLSQALGVA